MIHPKSCDGIPLGLASPSGSWKVGKVLRIGKIIDHNGESVESLVLEPQGIAHLISKECVELPDDKCALAHVLTRMCNDGLLTLNIGVVDPSWKNHLSSPVLNFSSEKRLLQVGQPFIRLTFHHIDVAAGALEKEKRKEPWDEATYVSDVRARAVGNFGRSFLNIEQLVGEASKKEAARLRVTMLKYIPIGAFSLAFFALLVTVGVATLARHATSDSSVSESEREWRAAIIEQQKVIADRLTQLEQSRKPKIGDEAAQPTPVAAPATHRADNVAPKATKPGGAE